MYDITNINSHNSQLDEVEYVEYLSDTASSLRIWSGLFQKRHHEVNKLILSFISVIFSQRFKLHLCHCRIITVHTISSQSNAVFVRWILCSILNILLTAICVSYYFDDINFLFHNFLASSRAFLTISTFPVSAPSKLKLMIVCILANSNE